MESEELYEIEKILGKRFRNCQPEYLVKWFGWSDKHNTWEGLKSFQTCP